MIARHLADSFGRETGAHPEPWEAWHTMSTAPAEDPTGGNAPDGLIRFTQRGVDALDALAIELTAGCGGRPEGIAELLDQVLHADMSELAGSLTAPADQPLVIDADLTQTPETPDEAARRRLGRPQDLPTAGDTAPSRSIPR